jgi:hypothetical protein
MEYIAWSTENFESCGITILAVADSPSLAASEGRKRLPAVIADIRDDTWHKNFRVHSKTALVRQVGKRAYGAARDRWLWGLEAEP